MNTRGTHKGGSSTSKLITNDEWRLVLFFQDPSVPIAASIRLRVTKEDHAM